jgi:hypothetical protein
MRLASCRLKTWCVSDNVWPTWHAQSTILCSRSAVCARHQAHPAHDKSKQGPCIKNASPDAAHAVQLGVLREVVPSLDARRTRFLMSKLFSLNASAAEELKLADVKSIFRGIMFHQSRKMVRCFDDSACLESFQWNVHLTLAS